MLEMYFQPISRTLIFKILGEACPQTSLQGVRKIILAPAWLEKFLDHNQKKFLKVFGFNQVGKSEYKGLLMFWLKYCDTVT